MYWTGPYHGLLVLEVSVAIHEVLEVELLHPLILLHHEFHHIFFSSIPEIHPSLALHSLLLPLTSSVPHSAPLILHLRIEVIIRLLS